MRMTLVLFCLTVCFPNMAVGQSILATGVLGIRTESLDAVQRSLGGVGLATGTTSILPGEPTASLDLLAPTVTMTVQPTWGHYNLRSEESDFRGTRFPILGFAYPLGVQSVLTVTAGSVFDQRWTATTRSTIDVSGNSVPIVDTFGSDGGISALRVGYARRLSATFAVGASTGLYRGHVDRTFNRSFGLEVDSVNTSGSIMPFDDAGRWSYSGPVASISASWDPSDVVQLSSSLNWSGTISGTPIGTTESEIIKVDPPLEIRFAATAILSSRISLTAGISTAKWEASYNSNISSNDVGRVNTLGAGIQWRAGNFWAGELPIRLGYRRTGFPFLFKGVAAVEKAMSGGFSIIMAETLGIPLATIDTAVEIGSRRAGDMDENFRRLTFTVRVGGN